MAKLAEAIPDSHDDAVQGLHKLLEKLQVKRALKNLGLKEENAVNAAKIATSNSYPNPREIEYEGMRECIRMAWAGEPANVDGM
jgi:alcohol dehydrogenase class IV